MRALPIAAACCALLAALAPEVAAAQAADADARRIYERECAMCHGVAGEGDGPGSHIVNPAPRNFALGVFKFRSTPSGEPPTDADLLRIIANGIPGTAMPAFAELPERERRALVALVKSLAEIRQPGREVPVPPEPRATPGRIAQGARVYERLQCAECHGASGRADGVSSLTLKDDAKQRIWAVDLSRGVFKGGAAPRDLYLRIVTGIDGSPMPAYAAKATPDELWSLVHYVRSLSAAPAAR
jgi:mono/diheme cytochrome c family protein